MKIFFDHIAGKLTNYDLLYSLILAKFDLDEYDYALDNGWIPLSRYHTKLDGQTWINARGARLNLTKFKFNKNKRYKLKRKDITVKIFDELTDELEDTLAIIYRKYIRYKNFHETNNEAESEEFYRDDPIDWKYFVYYQDDKPIAFTELITFNKHLVTGQFAWDYEDPKLGMGSFATLYEIKWALDNGYNKYYLSYAYENSSMYKSKYDGFEFWTGREWLSDKTIYKNLCNNDERIKNFTDLNDYQEKYFQILDKNKQ